MKKLIVLWKSDNLIDIKEMIFMYITNSMINSWWDQIEVIIWGASQKLVSENIEIQEEIKRMMNLGIKFHACKKCADDLCVSPQLKSIGIDVHYTGLFLTEKLQSDATVITL